LKVLEHDGKRFHASCLEGDELKVATPAHGYDDDEPCAGCGDPLGEEGDNDPDDDDTDDDDEEEVV
jgi:hypothetical protein